MISSSGCAVAGLVMAFVMMAWMYLEGRGLWTNPNLIAVMWMGQESAGRLGPWETRYLLEPICWEGRL